MRSIRISLLLENFSRYVCTREKCIYFLYFNMKRYIIYKQKNCLMWLHSFRNKWADEAKDTAYL